LRNTFYNVYLHQPINQKKMEQQTLNEQLISPENELHLIGFIEMKFEENGFFSVSSLVTQRIEIQMFNSLN
jgi:hypothetical protein